MKILDEGSDERDLPALLDSFRRRASKRKLRLFACAAARQVWDDLQDARSRACVEWAERAADDPVNLDAFAVIEQDARSALEQDWAAALSESFLARSVYASTLAVQAADLKFTAWDRISVPEAEYRPPLLVALQRIGREEAQTVKALLHCMGGPSSAPIDFDPRWRTRRTVALAAHMYTCRDFSSFPVLAQALKEAGCDHPDVLTHCGHQTLHARGCWVLDGLLEKE